MSKLKEIKAGNKGLINTVNLLVEKVSKVRIKNVNR